jgi:hypothetical protein
MDLLSSADKSSLLTRQPGVYAILLYILCIVREQILQVTLYHYGSRLLGDWRSISGTNFWLGVMFRV